MIGTATGYGQNFVSPIGGTAGLDWAIVNYTDVVVGSGIADYRGGNFTYDGHQGIDYALPNFAAMDRGVTVHAVQFGIVVNTNDGEFDRWSSVNLNPGDRPNFVVIDHGNGVFTEYSHLRKGSVSVAVGDVVAAGQQIGLVGSSGNSTDAHLHFGVTEFGNAVETYNDAGRWWQSPDAYAGDVAGQLDFGITDHAPTHAELIDRPSDHDLFLRFDEDQSVFSWVHLYGFDEDDLLEYVFYTPSHVEFAYREFSVPQIRYGWWFAELILPAEPELGTWRVDVLHNGNLLYSDGFLVAVPEPASMAFLLLFSAIVMGNWRARNERQVKVKRCYAPNS